MKLRNKILHYIFHTVLLLVFCAVLIHAQETIGDKQIKKGVWKGKEIDYVSGQVALFF